MIYIDDKLYIKQPDGRIGIPSVFEYQLSDGTRLPVPPTWETHPDIAKSRLGHVRPSLSYNIVVHDQEKYDFLLKSGWIYSLEHTARECKITNDRVRNKKNIYG